MRKRISSRPIWTKYLFALLAIIFMYLLFRNLVSGFDNNSVEIKILLACTLSSVFIYYMTRKRKIIEFDLENLYIISESNEKKIPLKKVTKLSPSLLDYKNPSWKLEYDCDTHKEEIRIVPSRNENANLVKFQKTIQEINPECQVLDKPILPI